MVSFQQFVGGQRKRWRSPDICHEPVLSTLLSDNQHRIVLDAVRATQYPYQKDYQRVHQAVYEDIEQRKVYSVVQVT